MFYSVDGHSEHVYAMRPMLEHVFAAVLYTLGELKANDASSLPKK